MKITSEPIQTETKPKYPYHGIDKRDGEVLLILGKGVAVVSKTGKPKDKSVSERPVGCVLNMGCFDEDDFTPITYKTTFEG